jgi:hypothetical protein
MPQGFILRFQDSDLIMTEHGSAIASGDADPVILQNSN